MILDLDEDTVETIEASGLTIAELEAHRGMDFDDLAARLREGLNIHILQGALLAGLDIVTFNIHHGQEPVGEYEDSLQSFTAAAARPLT